MKILLVTGSRHFTDYSQFSIHMNSFVAERHFDLVVAGACQGTDLMVERWCENAQYLYVAFPILSWEWQRLGKLAGPNRNKRMVNLMKPDECIAFLLQNALNKGSRNCSAYCESLGIPTTYINVSQS